MDVGDLPPLGFSAPESSRAEHVAQLTDSATDEYYIAMPADDFKRPHTLLVHYAILTGEVFQTAYTVSRTNEPWMSLQIRRGDTSIVSLEPPDLPPIGQRP